MRLFKALLALVLALLCMTLCGACRSLQEQAAPVEEVVSDFTGAAEEEASPRYKLAIIAQSAEPERFGDWYCVQPLIDKYGEDRVERWVWPENLLENQDKALEFVQGLLGNNDIRAIIINGAVPGAQAAIEKLCQEAGQDVFVAFNCYPLDEFYAFATANLVLCTDLLGLSPAMAEQAYTLGAKTLVYYSSPKAITGYQVLAYYPDFYDDDPAMLKKILKEQDMLQEGLEQVKQKCAELGLELVEVEAIDPPSNINDFNEYRFMAADIPQKVEKYGKDTAFYSTRGLSAVALIQPVIEAGAIFPQTWYPHPYEEFDRALLGLYIADDGYEADPLTYDDPGYVMASTEDIFARLRAALAKQDMLGRISTWPVRADYMYAAVAADYAFAWINGEVRQDGIDRGFLKQLMMDYAGVEVFLTPYTDAYPYTEEGSGEIFDSFLLVRMGYTTF